MVKTWDLSRLIKKSHCYQDFLRDFRLKTKVAGIISRNPWIHIVLWSQIQKTPKRFDPCLYDTNPDLFCIMVHQSKLGKIRFELYITNPANFQKIHEFTNPHKPLVHRRTSNQSKSIKTFGTRRWRRDKIRSRFLWETMTKKDRWQRLDNWIMYYIEMSFTCSCWSLPCESLMRSILFWRMRICFNFIISMAAKCSEVWGWGQDSLPAGKTQFVMPTFLLNNDWKT